MCDLSWVEQTQTLDAVERDVITATDANPRWKLLGVGVGKGGQTTLTYGWPWQGTVEIRDASEPDAAAQADDVEMRVRDIILDSLRELYPQTAGVASTATWLAEQLRAAGLIRGLIPPTSQMSRPRGSHSPLRTPRSRRPIAGRCPARSRTGGG